MTDAEKNIALLGVEVVLHFEPTDEELKNATADFRLRSETIRVRQLRVGKFEDAARALDREDEVAFTAVAIGKERSFVESLTPESYNMLASRVQEVNQSFFASYGRRVGRREGMKEGLRQAMAGNTTSPTS